MRQFHTVVLDTFRDLQSGYVTEPYEAAWSSEAIYYFKVERERAATGPLEFAVDISPDGMTWVEEGGTLRVAPDRPLSFVRVAHFGGWLRLRHTGGPIDNVQATVYLVLKE